MRKSEVKVNIRYKKQLHVFNLSSKATIKDLKGSIFNKLRIMPKNQALELDGINLREDHLELIGLSEQMPIQIRMGNLEERLFKFNGLQEKQQFPTQETTNKHDPLIIYPGLILRARCRKQGCTAYKKEVNVNMGFGKFDLGRMLRSSLCPLCSQKTDRVYNFGYYQTNIFLQGANDENGQFQWSDCANDGKFYLFKQDNGQLDWDYLEITTYTLY